jgi:hypothetical protein
MVEAMWPPNPPEVELHGHCPNMWGGWNGWVVVVLLQQRDDQLKFGLSWMINLRSYRWLPIKQ